MLPWIIFLQHNIFFCQSQGKSINESISLTIFILFNTLMISKVVHGVIEMNQSINQIIKKLSMRPVEKNFFLTLGRTQKIWHFSKRE